MPRITDFALTDFSSENWPVTCRFRQLFSPRTNPHSMNTIDPIGLGTGSLDDSSVITTAIDLGYRHFDTAQIYGTEEYVGEGISNAGVDREEVFIGTKVWTDRLAQDAVRPSVEESLERLGVSTIELLYVHWPRGDYEPTETLPEFDSLVDDGLVEHIGVSNFSTDQLDEAQDILDHPIAAHQFERHPLFQSTELVEYAQEHGHIAVAYAPSMAGKADEVPELRSIAKSHDVTATEVSLAWVIAEDSVVAIPRSSREAHLRANLSVSDFELTSDDIAEINAIDRVEELYLE